MRATTILALCFATVSALRTRTPYGVSLRGGGEEGADDAAADSLFGGDSNATAESSMADMMGQMGGMPPGFSGPPGGVRTARRARARARAPDARRARAGDPAEYEAAMEQFLDSPMMQEFLNDPEKVEQCRGGVPFLFFRPPDDDRVAQVAARAAE